MKTYQKRAGGWRGQAVENIKVNMSTVDESTRLPENGSPSNILVAPDLMTLPKNGSLLAESVPNTEPQKWLSVIQNDNSHYQKSGGKVLVKEQNGFLVVAYPNVVRCIKCHDWMISGNGCARCMAEYGLPENDGES